MSNLPLLGVVCTLGLAACLAAGCGAGEDSAAGSSAASTTVPRTVPTPTATNSSDPASARPEPISLRPGDRAQAGSSDLSCLAGPNHAVACGFGTAEKYHAGGLVVLMDPRRAAVARVVRGDSRRVFMRDHPGGPLQTSAAVAAGQSETFTLEDGAGVTIEGTTIRCTLVDAASFVCGSYVDGFEPGTLAVTIDRETVGVVRVRAGGKAEPVLRRRQGRLPGS